MLSQSKSLSMERLFADRTGLEPATSAVTGRHSNQLNYRSLVGAAKIGVLFIPAKIYKRCFLFF
jgi:hypothetical protein